MNKQIITSIGILIIGIIFGGLVFNGNGRDRDDTHMMPDGSVMTNMHSGDMNTMMMDMTANMQGKSGDELDKVFLRDMIVHHQGAVDMAKLLAGGTKRPELQKMASDIIKVQTEEINMMKDWEKQWFK